MSGIYEVYGEITKIMKMPVDCCIEARSKEDAVYKASQMWADGAWDGKDDFEETDRDFIARSVVPVEEANN